MRSRIAVGTLVVVAAALAVLLGGALRESGNDDVASAALFAQGSRSTSAYTSRLEQLVDDGRLRSDTLTSLGLAYLQRARETGDPAFYPRAESALKRALDRGEPAYLPTTGLASLAASRHRFALAAEHARRAIRLSPSSAAPYGILGDALVETGRYEEAFAAFDRMVALKPSAGSYARVSYGFELRGRTTAAIESMNLAVGAAAPVGESAAWARTLVGNLLRDTGRLTAAERIYAEALRRQPSYAPAIAAVADVRARQGRLVRAAELYDRALAIAPVPDYAVGLGDVLARLGRAAESRAAFERAQQLENRFARFGGRNVLETALFDLDHDRNLESALRRARIGARLRPSVEGEHALAWALYKNGKCVDARRHSIRALRLGTKDVGAIYHRFLIERCLGNDAAAGSFIARVRSIDPTFLDAPPSAFRLRPTIAGWESPVS